MLVTHGRIKTDVPVCKMPAFFIADKIVLSRTIFWAANNAREPSVTDGFMKG